MEDLTKQETIKDIATFFFKTGVVETLSEGILTAKAAVKCYEKCGSSVQKMTEMLEERAKKDDPYGMSGDWWKKKKGDG